MDKSPPTIIIENVDESVTDVPEIEQVDTRKDEEKVSVGELQRQHSLEVPKILPEKPVGLKRAQSLYGSTEKLHIDEEDLLLAVTLVQDAIKGRNFQFKTDPKHVRSYILYHNFWLRWLLYLFIFVNLFLALLEKPTKDGWLVPYWGSLIIEVTCLGFFLFRFCHSAHFSISHIFWKDTKNLVIIIIIFITVIDIICYCIWRRYSDAALRWSRPLRPLYIINFSDGKQIRRAFRNIRRTVPEIMNVLILFLLSVLLFGLLALKLFSKRSLHYANGDEYFSNYFDSIWDLYVLVTTANNPDVMMPSYDESNWFALFFIAYLIICLYIFMSIVLAAIYNNYKKNLKNDIKEAVFSKRKKLKEAFEILKVHKNHEDVVNHSTWCFLMKNVIPDKSQEHIDLLMKVLDVDGNNVVTKLEFLKLADLLNLRLTEVKDRLTFLEKKIPSVYNSVVSNVVKTVVRHRFFRYFFDFMIFVNAWFIGFDVAEDAVDWMFLSIFMIEILLKVYTFGPMEFMKRFWNVFDFLVIGSAVIATAVEAAKGATGDELNTLDLLLVLRVLRLIKLFGSIKRFKVILQTIINIGPSIYTYGGVIFVFYYMFAIVGMEIFGGLIKYYDYKNESADTRYCGNPKLANSSFYANHYCGNNFNDLLKSLVLLFELTVVNQWHVLSDGFVQVTNKAARLYFFSFHICCVVIVLNIFIAFVLEAFILEYSLQKAGKLESAVESKIKELGLSIGQTINSKTKNDNIELVANEELPAVDNLPHIKDEQAEAEDDSDRESIPDFSKEKGLKFHIRKRSRKKVEVLLQQMFEGEIDADDGMDVEANAYRPRRLTLDNVT